MMTGDGGEARQRAASKEAKEWTESPRKRGL